MATYYQRITVLLNPRAGKHDATARQVAEAFRAAGAEVDISLAEGPAIAAEAADAIRRGSRVVVAGGGDGTISTVAGVLAGTGAALGLLPLGTLNHFAKDLGIPANVDEAARAIVAGRTLNVDVGEVNGRPFINNVSIGMYARLLVERAAMQRIGRGKWLAHGLAALRVWRHYRRLRVDIRTSKGEVGRTGDAGSSLHVRTPFVFVGNNEYQLSGLELGGRKDLAGGRLHVCMAPGMTRGGVARMVVQALFGDVCAIEGFESFSAPAVELDARVARLEVSIDGEAVTLDTPLAFGIRPRALRVIVP